MVKDLAFPDPAWQRRVTIASGLYAFFGVLVWYWAFGWLLISGNVESGLPAAGLTAYSSPDGPYMPGTGMSFKRR
jgi:hypothetical protein